ncbi:Radical SAM domain protein [Staphylothermus marinus F1]|uniref:Radical SAM domain protein n=1 Tax=Staphylothermus marinus (strain ATCC 43588 / DSM 3639 / JCM 9404 / F1) TaxID=399550 RepID=A3DMD5_STAMF|nr:radical SAM protein [Staphylothermus marinus]ABN69795.1 Radical SAM domain protein [Staphylothermus marinus F1]
MVYEKEYVKPSPFYEVYDEKKKIIRCTVCERRCVLAPGLTGICWNHKNIGGKLYNIAYGLLSAVEPRPIEIKPLFHYYPNSIALTFSGWGCNFRCPWCQNYHISWSKPDPDKSIYMEPRKLVELAKKLKNHGLCASFNEPTIHLEYLLDVGEYAVKQGLYLTMVTNGYMTLKTIKYLLRHGYTGFSIDIKGCPYTYKKYLSANPLIIYRNTKTILDHGGHAEMVYLVVPKANDWRECYEWIIDNHLKYLGENVPLHINRYYPANKYYEPPTNISKLVEIKREAEKAGIDYVYIGNTPYEEYEYTRCPRCGKVLIVRRNYRVIKWNLTKDHRCPRCGYKINIYGEYIHK